MKNILRMSSSWPQWIAAIEVFLMAFVCGTETGWTSPSLAILLGKVESKPSPIPTSESEASWIASLLNIGRAAGGLIGAIDVEFVGSKTTVLHIGLVQAISLIFLGLADSVIWINVSRTIGGIATGMFFIAFPLYMGEISNPKIRGSLVGTIANGMSIGYVVGNITGAYLSIPAFAWLMLTITLLFLASFYWIPKTSHHLVVTGQMEEASAAMKWYQRDADVSNELPSLQTFIKDKQSLTINKLFKEFMLPHNRIALIKVNMVYILMQLSGLYTVGFYMEIIFKEGRVDIIRPNLAVIIVSTVGLIGGFFAVFAIDRFGRKLVLSTSAFGLAVALASIAIHFQLLTIGYDHKYLQWFIITVIVVLEFFLNLAIVPIPSTILSEIFAPNIKSYSACIANITSGLVAFLCTQTYQVLLNSIRHYVYYLYAAMMISLSLFTMTQLPETKGKSLQEIQNMLMKK